MGCGVVHLDGSLSASDRLYDGSYRNAPVTHQEKSACPTGLKQRQLDHFDRFLLALAN